MTPKEVIEFARANEARVIDARFCDLLGAWQHFTLPAAKLNEALFTKGLGFDASFLRGFQEIQKSDMRLIPDPDTALMDPFTEIATLSLLCDLQDQVTCLPLSRDPRHTAKKAEKYLRESGIADVAYFRAQTEFHLFNSDEAAWNSNREEAPNVGFKSPYTAVSPHDTYQDIRTEMLLTMTDAGIDVEMLHPVAETARQTRIDLKFQSLLKHADTIMLYKYIVKNVASQNGLTATFMPKPLFGDHGSGMRTHVSFWKDGQTLMFDESGYGKLSELAVHYIGGILKHAPAVLAFAAPTTNSYRRLVPGDAAPTFLAYSSNNRSACCGIPAYCKTPDSTRVEFRAPDPSANPYLAFSAILMAGIDGIKNKIAPPAPVDFNLNKASPSERKEKGIAAAPESLDEALNALEADHAFLLQGGVFTEDLIETYIAYKREIEIDAIRRRPHPHEFTLYFNV